MGDKPRFLNISLANSGTRWAIALVTLGLISIGATLGLTLLRPQAPEDTLQPQTEATPLLESVTALGRIEPQGEALQLSPPPTLGTAKVAKLFVEEGDKVQAEQIIAELDDRDRLQAALDRAIADLSVAVANLRIVEAGAKTGEIQAAEAAIQRLQAQLKGETQTQQAAIARLQAELRTAESEYNRFRELAQGGAISDFDLEQRKTSYDTAQERLREAQANNQKTIDTLNQQILEAQANRDRIAEIRPVDIAKAQAEVQQAQASIQQAQADLETAFVRAPSDGQILQINTRPGESVSTDGIVELGQTERMVVVAEVYESDIGYIKVGQTATITSENGSFSDALSGTVSHVGLQINKKDVLDTDPAAETDARVVEVDILLSPEASQKVAGLTNAKVLVDIEI
ncbi:MAG: ABC exporter membrane fusion protein [Jaaginema sp. PMC 1079.18]|nr:ABC exporter membrane fusion protein [Jaaginema sp. PMC 1080.18]MEC4849977.1 ABC exporter membrane fusion protein [Jaaginema sp. PMC 1079.18]MEC4865193.1 ABC exporter membrane fusion protein [Jaaginema sp. PMC 1078.18]